MPDLLPVDLVEMIAELERDLLARRRSYANRIATGRLSHATALRRIEIVEAVIKRLRDAAGPGVLEAMAQRQEQKKQRAKQRKEARGDHPRP